MRKFKKYLFFLLFLVCPTFTLAEQIDINTATLSQLDKLTGIGPALGQRIIDSRPYASVDDLLKVQGIGPKNLEKIKQQGLATTTPTNNLSTSSEQATTSQMVKTSPLPNQTTPANSSREIITKPADRPILLYLSEVLPSPEGADTENEFIEIFNTANFTADISGFKIKDTIGAIKTFTIPIGTKISANNFLTFKSGQTKISLNNSGDGVELLDPSGKIIDSIDFGKSQSGQSWSKTENIWQWTAKPTPNQVNIVIAISTNTSTSSAQATSSTKNNLTANIQNYSPQKKNFLAVGIATAIALFSALIAWRIKKTSHEV